MTRRSFLRTLRRAGPALPLGLALLALAALLAFVAVPHWSTQADDARAEAKRLRAERAENDRRRVVAAPAALVRDAWPAASRAGDRAADLLEHSLRSGVEVQRTQQRIDRIAGAGVEVLRLQQTVRAGYADARRLAGAALLADPALGLERLRLQRGSPAAREFDGELHWALAQRAAEGTR